MLKLLTSLALVVAQGSSWSEGPLYLCVNRDGQACIDTGPQNCDCCTTAASHSACSDAPACTAPTTSVCAASCDHPRASTAPCDCTHEQLKTDQATPPTRQTCVGDPLQLRAGAAAYVVSLAQLPNASATVAHSRAACATILGLSVLSSVVIRC